MLSVFSWHFLDVIVFLSHVDVIAYVKEVGTLDEYRKDNETKQRLTMVLCYLEYVIFSMFIQAIPLSLCIL